MKGQGAKKGSGRGQGLKNEGHGQVANSSPAKSGAGAEEHSCSVHAFAASGRSGASWIQRASGSRDLTGRDGCNNVGSVLLHFRTSIAAKKFADTFHNRYVMDLLPRFDSRGRILQVTAVSRTLKESIERLIVDFPRHLAEHPDDDDDDDDDDDHC